MLGRVRRLWLVFLSCTQLLDGNRFLRYNEPPIWKMNHKSSVSHQRRLGGEETSHCNVNPVEPGLSLTRR